MRDDRSNMEFFRQMFGGSWITQAIWVAAELGIADLLADGPKTVEELSKKTNTHSDALYRVLRALASVGIFAQDEALRFHQLHGLTCCDPTLQITSVHLRS